MAAKWIMFCVFSVYMSLIDSEMAGPIGLKLGGMVESIRENVLVKIFFGFLNPRWSANGLYSKKMSVLCFSVCLCFPFFQTN